MTDEATGLQPEAVEPAGLDAILSKNLEGYGDEPKAAPAEAEEAPAKEVEPKLDATGRAHAADGKFTSKKSAEATPSEPEPAAEAKPAEVPQVEPPKPEPIQPPAKWTDADKAEFAKLTPEAQKLVLARHNAMEGDYTRKTQELAESRRSLEPLSQEVGKWSPYLQQIGVKPEQAFAQMLQTEHTLRTGTPEQKLNAISYLAQYYGVPLPNSQGGMDQPNPALTQLHQTVATLQQRLQQKDELEAQRERQWAQAEFDAVGQTKDTNGQLKYPHFARVSQTMLQMVANGQANTWEAAYDAAVWANPELRQQQIEAERQRVLAETERQRLEAVEKAKKAQPVKTSDGSPKGGKELKGLDAHLSAALDRLGT